ncbi:methionyl-tRNA formyltransferase [Paenibacillus sp. IHBB 10380]|uniref:methionyl-tRNA formyltransferase n=1 Tax=Paenibacillus sp. IHBB 10380 TaxID=1566358 RepID=UPI0005CFAECC|nr:methionyl-tRNA formyltransferase [Paenibacillus sp. IHBB 10380]AJS57862.1 methionyl-tRNA formyltransferase [Paenibacillus sp. IHBB 10380]
MNIVFMGTPAFAVPSLRRLIKEGYNVVAVVTQPDRPQGRKKVLTPTPVKEVALEFGLPVLQPQRMRSPEAVEQLAVYQPDLIVTAAYGQILPKAVLDMPRLGCVNIHGSLLPKYRGGAPIQRSIINGETVTGITLMYMAEGLDTGDMISQIEIPIEDHDTSGSVFEKLSEVGASLLQRELPLLLEGRVTAIPQNDEESTYAPNLKREDEKIDWNRSSRDIYNQIRGLLPFSGAFTIWEDEVFKVWEALVPTGPSSEGTSSIVPGTVLQLSSEGIEVATADGSLRLIKVQPSGKKVLEVDSFLRGTSMAKGTVLT